MDRSLRIRSAELLTFLLISATFRFGGTRDLRFGGYGGALSAARPPRPPATTCSARKATKPGLTGNGART
jgi:hypothetical protein